MYHTVFVLGDQGKFAAAVVPLIYFTSALNAGLKMISLVEVGGWLFAFWWKLARNAHRGAAMLTQAANRP